MEPAPARTTPRFVPSLLATGMGLLAVLVRIFFWWYTNRTWEDALITLQHAENAARGFGLTHHPGEGRVHGFTSPISVLIPILGEFLHHGFGLPFLKIISAISGGISAFLGVRIAQELRLATPIVFLVGGYLAIEHQQILYGMSGMETQVAVAILLFSIYTVLRPEPRRVGIGLGLCMMARPDFLFWVILAMGLLAWKYRRDHRVRPLVVAAGALLAVYGPWLAFTTWYYGSPVPNTIRAKEFGYPNQWFAGLSWSDVVDAVWYRIPHDLFGGLGPAYSGNGTGFQFFDDQGKICLVVLLFLFPCLWTAWRKKDLPCIGILGFVIVYALYYLLMMVYIFGWYTVPLAAATILACAIGMDTILAKIPDQRFRAVLGTISVMGYLVCLTAILPAAFRGDRHVQEYVEDEVRKPIGIYLASVMGPQQTLGCESLGYFGYYSRRMVYDYPGLASPSVVEFMRNNPNKRTLIDMLEHFRPDFIVLRSYEYAAARKNGATWLRTDYDTIREFKVPSEKVAEMLFPARNIDLDFLVLRRKQ
jgi:hypothetical protein